MNTTANELRDIASRLQAIADRQRPRDEKLAIDVMRDLTPLGTTLYASKAADGVWWYYLVMPTGWTPPEGPRWIYNESRDYYWDSGTAVPWGQDGPNTAQAALKRGLQRLLEVL
jgi:hypothetical protein